MLAIELVETLLGFVPLLRHATGEISPASRVTSLTHDWRAGQFNH
jgi:hypothetical protein